MSHEVEVLIIWGERGDELPPPGKFGMIGTLPKIKFISATHYFP